MEVTTTGFGAEPVRSDEERSPKRSCGRTEGRGRISVKRRRRGNGRFREFGNCTLQREEYLSRLRECIVTRTCLRRAVNVENIYNSFALVGVERNSNGGERMRSAVRRIVKCAPVLCVGVQCVFG